MTATWHRGPWIAEVVTEQEGRVALLNLAERRSVVLTGTAAVIWGLIDGNRTEDAILAVLSSLYGPDGAADRPAQLESFLAALERQGLVEARA